ncbi:MAG: DsbA family protein [Deltaproteobacteria bacterium]|nr:DsbA family protein [Deltaproteobacteria bacterium]
MSDTRRGLVAGIRPWGLLAALLALLVAVPAVAQRAAADPPEAETVVDVGIAGWSPIVGPADAPVTLVVFTEYLCPFCRRLEPVLDQLREAYGDRIRIVYRFRTVHPGAEELSAAALAAHRQGKFRMFHERLFANQQLLRERPQYPVRLAQQLGLDVERFRADWRGESIRKQVEADQAEAERLEVNGVPTTFVNGRELSGAQGVEKFGELIDRLLGIQTPTVFTTPEPATPPTPVQNRGTGEDGTPPPPPEVLPPTPAAPVTE